MGCFFKMESLIEKLKSGVQMPQTEIITNHLQPKDVEMSPDMLGNNAALALPVSHSKHFCGISKFPPQP